MNEKSTWKPDQSEAIKRLIRTTIEAAGPLDAASIPHLLKETLRGQATGDLDVEAYVKQVLAEMKKKSGA